MKNNTTPPSAKITPIKIVIIVFVIIAIGLALHLKLKQSERVATIKQSASSFALLDTTAIDKVIIFNGKATITLTKNGSNGWVYNGKSPANKPAVSALLKMMLTLSPQGTVPEKEMDKEAIALRSSGIKVQFYAGDIEDRAFYVNNAAAQSKTIMMMVSTGAPHYVTAPGYGNQVNQLFAADETTWETTTLLSSTLKSIQSVEAVSETLPSFKIEYDAGFYKFNSPKQTNNQTLIKAYFKDLIDASIDEYVANNDLLNKPLATLTIIDVENHRNCTITVLKIENEKALIKCEQLHKMGYISTAKLKRLFPLFP
jgi:hypothetical protein